MGGPLGVDEERFRDARDEVARHRLNASSGAISELASLELLAAGAVIWPPSFDVMTAAEVKAVVMTAQYELKATRSGRAVRKFHAQAENLCRMGFDRVALVWASTTEPDPDAVGLGSQTWIRAAVHADTARGMLVEQLHETRNSRFGQIAISIGSVLHATESAAGAASAHILAWPPELRARTPLETTIRDSVKEVLARVMSRYPVPRTLPVIIRACGRRGCPDLFMAAPPQNRRCPTCGDLT